MLSSAASVVKCIIWLDLAGFVHSGWSLYCLRVLDAVLQSACVGERKREGV